MGLTCARVVQFIRQSSGDPIKNDEGVSLFFHSARSSKLYGWFYGSSLRLLDALANLFVMRGHSPFNLQMLSYVDELWPGGRRSLSAGDLASLAQETDNGAQKSKTQ